MPVTNYYTVNGEITGEETNGQRIDYLTDPLGNVTATIDQNAKVLNRYTYKPFGEMLSKTGTAPDPKFLWVGAHGYRQTGKKYADVYVRKRSYDTRTGRWTSKDPARESRLSGYLYATTNPTTYIDPTGLICNATDVKPWITTIDCNTQVKWLCGACIGCWYKFEASWSLDWTINTRHGGREQDCCVLQWVSEDGGPYQRDSALGWPYPFVCGRPNRRGQQICSQLDQPLWTGWQYCYAHFHEYWEFITCLCDKNRPSPLSCHKWLMEAWIDSCHINCVTKYVSHLIPKIAPEDCRSCGP